jgi:site-specific DNA-methyltransferase (adenine-specific)
VSSPYYDKDGITLYCGDCRELLPSIDCSAVNVVIADPPYGETSLRWDRWPDRWLTAVGDAVPTSVSLWCFGTMRMFLDRIGDFAFWKFAQDIIWEKHNGSGFHVDRFRRVHENICQFYRVGTDWGSVYKNPQFTMDATARTVRKKQKPPQWHGKTGATTYTSVDGGPRMMRSVLQVRSEHGRALNETQKPQRLVESIVEYSCPPGGTILSPFSGSGTDLVVAKHTGRRAIGFEVREEQCAIAVNRLRQGVMFATETST